MIELSDFRPSDFRDWEPRLQTQEGVEEAKALVERFLTFAQDDGGAEADHIFVVARKLSLYRWFEYIKMSDLIQLLRVCKQSIAEKFVAGLPSEIAAQVNVEELANREESESSAINPRALGGLLARIAEEISSHSLAPGSKFYRGPKPKMRIGEFRKSVGRVKLNAGFPATEQDIEPVLADHLSGGVGSDYLFGPSGSEGDAPGIPSLNWLGPKGVVIVQTPQGVVVNVGDIAGPSYNYPKPSAVIFYNPADVSNRTKNKGRSAFERK
jgi:hypothetical protein